MDNKFKKAYEYLEPRIEGDLVLDEPLNKYTTLRVGGNARLFANAETLSDLKNVVDYSRNHGLKCMLIGRGANLLISDDGFDGLAIKLGREFNKVSTDKETKTITAGGAAILAAVLKEAIANSLEGLAFAAGIPATVGGAIASNAGANGKHICDLVKELKVLDKDKLVAYKEDSLETGYRKGPLNKGEIVIEAQFQLKMGEKGAIKGRAERFFKERKTKQPLNQANAGSVFKNPSAGKSAGELIEKCGLKGAQKGDAMISDVHANFIVNKGQAKASDVYALLNMARKKVNEYFGILLEPEINIIGRFDND